MGERFEELRRLAAKAIGETAIDDRDDKAAALAIVELLSALDTETAHHDAAEAEAKRLHEGLRRAATALVKIEAMAQSGIEHYASGGGTASTVVAFLEEIRAAVALKEGGGG